MDLLHKLKDAPLKLFDWTMECEEEGFIPSQDDVHDYFGDRFKKWEGLFPEDRQKLFGEVDDCQFQRFDEMKYSGHKLSDFE